MQSHATWIHIVLSFKLKLKMFIKILQIMLRKHLKSNYEINRPLSTRKNKEVIDLMKDELGKKVMTEFVELTSKTFS